MTEAVVTGAVVRVVVVAVVAVERKLQWCRWTTAVHAAATKMVVPMRGVVPKGVSTTTTVCKCWKRKCLIWRINWNGPFMKLIVCHASCLSFKKYLRMTTINER